MRTPPDGGVLISEKLPLDYTHSSGSPLCQEAWLLPPGECPPVLAAVKHSPLDVGCVRRRLRRRRLPGEWDGFAAWGRW